MFHGDSIVVIVVPAFPHRGGNCDRCGGL